MGNSYDWLRLCQVLVQIDYSFAYWIGTRTCTYGLHFPITYLHIVVIISATCSSPYFRKERNYIKKEKDFPPFSWWGVDWWWLMDVEMVQMRAGVTGHSSRYPRYAWASVSQWATGQITLIKIFFLRVEMWLAVRCIVVFWKNLQFSSIKFDFGYCK